MVASRESTPAKEPAYLNGFVDGSDLVLLYRDERGQMLARRRRAEWSSFYRREQVSADVMRDLRNSSFVVGVSEEKDRVRVRWQAPEWRRKAHEEGGWAETAGLTAFEADVSEVARYFQETGAEVAKPRRVYLDIETDSRVPPAVVRQGKARVLCWSLVDEDVRVVAQGLLREDTDEDERRVLEEFWRAIDPYDQVVAWYGDGFDFPIVKLRSQTTGANVKDPRRWLWLDFMPVYERMNRNAANSGAEKESMRLQDVAMSRLGEGKTPFDASKTWEEWAAGGERRQRLVDYCAQDTKLLPKLERKTGFLDVNDAICQVSRQFADTQSANPTSYVDGFLLRMGHEQGLRFPSRARYGQEEQKKHEQFAGAFVMEPKCHGIERDIHVVDFSGMYPSIILTWNMSPETKRAIAVNGPIPAGHCRSPSTRVGFSTEHAGILCEAVKKIRAMRKHYQKLQASLPPGTPEWTDAGRLSTAYKVIANAFYGVVGSPFSRFFDRQIAESVSQNGVWLAQKTRYEAETRGMEVVYMDTDSLFVRGTTREAIAAFVEWCNAELYPKLVAECGCVDNHVEIAYEKEFERLVFVSAKKYCNPPEAPIWMADGTFKPIGEVRPGDHVMGWVRGEDGKRTSLVESVVVGTQRRRAPIVRVRLESGKTIRCTEDHRWLRSRELRSRRGSLHYSYPWCTPKKGREIVSVVEQPRKLSHAEEVEASWLGGIWDGEGSLCSDNRGQIVFAQSPRKNPEVCARIESALRLLGFDFGVHGGSGGVNVYAIRGGLQERVNFLAWCKPAKGHRLARSFFRSRFRTPDKIVAVEPDEKDGEVVALQTTTGNYVAWGYASKNCATYRHYKWTASCACDTKGEPGALDVRTMTCKDCGKTWGALPPPRGEPEIRGLEYKRGGVIRIARKLLNRIRYVLKNQKEYVPAVVQ